MSYATIGTQTVTAAYISALTLTGSTSVIVRLLEFNVGQASHAANNEIIYKLQRTTAAGTGDAATPEPLDADRALAAGASGLANHSGEPTYAGAAILEVPIDQRAAYRWVAVPGAEPISALATANGWGFAVKSGAYTGDAHVNATHSEGV